MLAICGGGMRTGSVAIHQILQELVRESPRGVVPKTPTEDVGQVGRWANRPAWVAMKAHGVYGCFRPYPARIRAVVTYRNHLDVVVSLMKFQNLTFEEVLGHNRFYSNMKAYREWTEFLPANQLLLLRYEDSVIANRTETVVNIAAFLGLSVSPERAGKIADRWSIEANKKRAAAKNPISSPDYFAERHIYSAGQSLWHEKLTPEQVERVLADPLVAAWQKEMGYV